MSDTPYIKNYDIGTATLDLPYFFYKHRIDFTSLKDDYIELPVGLVYTSRGRRCESDTRFYGKNLFGIVPGLKLTAQKKLVFPTTGSPLKTALMETDGSVTEFSENMATDGSGRILTAQTDGTFTITKDGSRIVEIYNSLGDIVEIRQIKSATDYSTLLYYTYDKNHRLMQVLKIPSMSYIAMTYDTSRRISRISVESDTTASAYGSITFSYDDYTRVILPSGEQYWYDFSSGFAVYGMQSDEIETTCITAIVCTESADGITVAQKYSNLSYTASQMTYRCLHYTGEYVGDFFETEDKNGVRTRYQYENGKPAFSYEVIGDGDDDMFYTYESQNPSYPGTVYNAYKADVTFLQWQNVLGTLRQDACLPREQSQAYSHFFTVSLESGKQQCLVISGWIKGDSVGQTFSVTYNETAITSFSAKSLPSDNHWYFFMHPLVLSPAQSGDVRIGIVPVGTVPSSVSLADIRMNKADKDFSFTRAILHQGGDADATYYLDEIERFSYVNASGETLHITDPLGFNDIWQYFRRIRKDTNDRRLFVESSGEAYPCCRNLRFFVGSRSYSVEDYSVGMETTNDAGKRKMFVKLQATDEYDYRTYTYVSYKGALETLIQDYDEYGLLLKTEEILPAGAPHRLTEYTYNGNGQLLSRKYSPTYSSGNTSYMEESCEIRGNTVSSYTDTDGVRETYTSDPVFGVLTGITESDGRKYEATYDKFAAGITKTSIKNAADVQETNATYGYGTLNKLTQNKLSYFYSYADGHLTRVSYGIESALTTLFSATYDDATRTYGATSPSGRTVTRTEDIYGRTVKKKVGGTNAVTVTYGGTTFGKGTNTENVNGSSYITKITDHVTSENTSYAYVPDVSETITVKDRIGNIKKRVYNAKNEAIKTQYTETTFYGTPIDDIEQILTNSKKTATYDVCLSLGQPQNKTNQIAYTVRTPEVGGTASDVTFTETFAYDAFDRVETSTLTYGTESVQRTNVYQQSGLKHGNRLVGAKHKNAAGRIFYRETYSYDEYGRIRTFSDKYNRSYAYDALGRLVRENHQKLSETYLYEYDVYGNMTSKKTYAYTTAETPSTLRKTQTFTYSNSNTRPDRLTAVDGKAVGYGGDVGTSLCSFDGKTYNWTNGLLSGFTRGNATEGSEKYTYRYNGHGQRIGKTYTFTPGTVTLIEYTTNESYNYYYNGDGTLHMMTHDTITKLGDNTYRKLVFLYDSTGVAGCVYIKNTNAPTVYRFVKNSLGDIVAILDDAGDTKAEYLYDAYGNCAISGDFSNGFAEENPFRYRGYFYDTETGFYYCQTRYYNPAWGRFISMDSPDYLSPDSVAGMNLYVYCGNNPVMYKQSSALSGDAAASVLKDNCHIEVINFETIEKMKNREKSFGINRFNLFGYEWRTSAGWDTTPEIATYWFGRIGHSSYITHTKGRSGMLYVFAGSTSDVTNWLGTTLYAGIGINFLDVAGVEIQLELLGAGIQFSIGDRSLSINVNGIGATSITIGRNIDLGNGMTETSGITVGLNTGLLVAVFVWIYKVITTGDTSPVPGLVPA